jgi:hypothetical protein
MINAYKNTHFAWVAGGRVLMSTPEGFNSKATILPSDRQAAKIFVIPGFHAKSRTNVSDLLVSRTSVTTTISYGNKSMIIISGTCTRCFYTGISRSS